MKTDIHNDTWAFCLFCPLVSVLFDDSHQKLIFLFRALPLVLHEDCTMPLAQRNRSYVTFMECHLCALNAPLQWKTFWIVSQQILIDWLKERWSNWIAHKLKELGGDVHILSPNLNESQLQAFVLFNGDFYGFRNVAGSLTAVTSFQRF